MKLHDCKYERRARWSGPSVQSSPSSRFATMATSIHQPDQWPPFLAFTDPRGALCEFKLRLPSVSAHHVQAETCLLPITLVGAEVVPQVLPQFPPKGPSGCGSTSAPLSDPSTLLRADPRVSQAKSHGRASGSTSATSSSGSRHEPDDNQNSAPMAARSCHRTILPSRVGHSGTRRTDRCAAIRRRMSNPSRFRTTARSCRNRGVARALTRGVYRSHSARRPHGSGSQNV